MENHRGALKVRVCCEKKKSWMVGWLVVLGFNATLTAKVISWLSVTHIVFPDFLTPALTQLSFKSHRQLFLNASAEVKGENTPERKFASTGSRTPNHQVMSPTRTPLSQPGGRKILEYIDRCIGRGQLSRIPNP